MAFEDQFQKLLLHDLSSGVYGNGTEFANGITRHYMTSIQTLIPAAIPATLPSPANSGAPMPIGPGVPINNFSRKKAFNEVIRAYFVAKDISQGKLQIKQLSEDIQRTIALSQKVVRDVDRLYSEIAAIDDEIKQLKDDLKNIKPDFEKFVREKTNSFKDVGREFQSMLERFRQADLNGIAVGFDYAAVFAEEVTIIETLLNFKPKAPTNLREIIQLFQTLTNIAKSTSDSVRKYKNTFTKEANLKQYFVKKIKAFVFELTKLFNAFVRPEKYVNIIKDLILIPGANRFAKVLLRIVNNNKILKAKKEAIIKNLKAKRESVMPYLKKKLDALKNLLAVRAQEQADRVKKDKKQRRKFKLPQEIRDFAKEVAGKVKKIAQTIDYYMSLLEQASKIGIKVLLLIDKIRADIETAIASVVEYVKTKYATVKDTISKTNFQQLLTTAQEGLSAESLRTIARTGNLDADQIAKAFEINVPILANLVKTMQQLLGVSPNQLQALIRKPIAQVQGYVGVIDDILNKDIPRLRALLQNVDPRSPDYAKQKALANQATAAVTDPDHLRHKRAYDGYMKVIQLSKNAMLELEEFKTIITDTLEKKKKQQQDELLKKDYLETYIESYTSNTPADEKRRKRQNKQRERQQKILNAKTKLEKFKKLAIQTQLAYSITTRGLETAANLLTSNRPISDNDANVGVLYRDFLEFQRLRGRVSESDKKRRLNDYRVEIRDLKAYEHLYILFRDLIKEVQAGNLIDDLKKQIQGKIDSKTDKVKDAFSTLFNLFETDPSQLKLADLIKLPVSSFYMIDVITELALVEKRNLQRFRSRFLNADSFIPEETNDPILIRIRGGLKKASSCIVWLLDVVFAFVKKIISLVKEKIVDPIIDWVKNELKERKVRLEREAQENIIQETEKRVNLDAKVMSVMFGLAARLFWTGLSWTNPVGTRFLTTNIGRFTPIKGQMVGGADAYATEVAKGFGKQLKDMSGLYIPKPDLLILPLSFKGYLPPPAVGPAPVGVDTIAMEGTFA